MIAARNLFGDVGAVLVTAVLCASLLGSAAAMTVAGPRVYYALGRDYRAFALLASVIETCRQRKVSPWPYLAEVIAQRRKGNPAPPLPLPAS